MSAEPRVSYSEVLRDAAEYCDEFSADQKLTWESYRPARYEAPAATAAALRQLARLVEEAEKAEADLAANVSTQGDEVYEYEMRCHALTSTLAAGFQPDAEAQG